jgi:V/A-type H+-transporting ATPase subunit E
MKGLETGKQKMQKICDVLRKETLDPAKQEAREIVENAHAQASHILGDAKKKAQEILQTAEKEIEEKKKVFHSSLQMAARQGVEQFKQKIEHHLFNQELSSLVEKEMGDPKVIGQILNAFLKMMEEKGIDDQLIALIPKNVSPRAINSLLSRRA